MYYNKIQIRVTNPNNPLNIKATDTLKPLSAERHKLLGANINANLKGTEASTILNIPNIIPIVM